MTQEEKLQYIEKHLDSNGENKFMQIHRSGYSFRIGGGDNRTIMLHTGIGGCYDYIKTFYENMRQVNQDFFNTVGPGLFEQTVVKSTRKPPTIEEIEEAVKNAFKDL